MSLLEKLAEKALATLGQRGQENGYDKKPGTAQEERSAAQIARVFNALTGHQLTTTDAWTFLQVLKLVRMENQIKTGSGDLLDSCNDMISYSLLKAETALQGYRPAQAEELTDGIDIKTPVTHSECFGVFGLRPWLENSPGVKIDTGNHASLSEETNATARAVQRSS